MMNGKIIDRVSIIQCREDMKHYSIIISVNVDDAITEYRQSLAPVVLRNRRMMVLEPEAAPISPKDIADVAIHRSHLHAPTP